VAAEAVIIPQAVSLTVAAEVVAVAQDGMVAQKRYTQALLALLDKAIQEVLVFIITEHPQVHTMAVVVAVAPARWATVDQIEINKAAAAKAWHQTLAVVLYIVQVAAAVVITVLTTEFQL
jgi:hypothetical protein